MARFCNVVAFSREALLENAPDEPGIYEIGYWVEPHFFVPRYLGRARGKLDPDAEGRGTTIRKRLLKHVSDSHNAHINRARAGRHLKHWLHDPDEPRAEGFVKMDIDRRKLWCRWMRVGDVAAAAAIAAERETNLLRAYGIGTAEAALYVWNKKY